MSRKKIKRVHGPLCDCESCDMLRTIAVRLVNNKADLRDIHEEYRPFVLAEREKRNPTSGGVLGGGIPNGESAIARAEQQYEGGGNGPWHENAVRALEDGE